MKKRILSLLLIFIFLFVFTSRVSAAAIDSNIEKVSTGEDDRGHFDVYQIYIRPASYPVNINIVKVQLILTNVTISSNDFTMGQDWYLDAKNDTTHEYTFGTKQVGLSVTKHIIVRLKAYRINTAQGCSVTLKLPEYPTCRTCEYYRGSYYGSNGQIVDAYTYNVQCFTHVCEIVQSGNNKTYFDDEGNVTTAALYEEKCGEHVCEEVNGVYYDRTGQVVTQAEYNESCMPKCEYKDNKYYGKDGSVVTEEVYLQQCTKQICKKVGDKYYDNEGKEVTKAQYEDACTTPKCGEKNGQYYDLEGNPISKETYAEICFSHSSTSTVCSIKDGKYYDKSGKAVTKAEYDKQCAEVSNPKTGLIVPIAIGGAVLLISGLAYYSIRRKQRFI